MYHPLLFHRPADGGGPISLTLYAGDVYGVAQSGGAADAGVLFKIDPLGHETVLYSFTAVPGFPVGGLLSDLQGNFYGTAFGSGVTGGFVYRFDVAGR